MKKLLVSNFIILICFSAFMLGYSSLEGISFADTEIEWENCTTAEEQAEAFKAYCKSRDLTIEGSIADGVTSFTTQTYQNLINTLGLNVNALQADIKKATDSNGAVKYLFNASGISAMNRIFSQFLQDHDLDVGDTADQQNNTIYNGQLYTDPDGNSCLVTVINPNNPTVAPLEQGSPYIYNQYTIESVVDSTYSSSDNPFTWNVNYYNTNGVLSNFTYNLFYFNNGTICNITNRANNGTYNYLSFYSNANKTNIYQRGYPAIIRNPSNDRLYLGYYTYPVSSGYIYSYYMAVIIGTASDVDDCIIFITTNNQTINNNDYSNNTYTTINNNGDVYNYDTDDEPDPDTPVTPDPPTPDDPTGGTPPDDWDIELPDLSNTDWVIYGLEKKFPWDIPFNMMFILSLLNAEPITPHFEGTIDLKVCTWNYDLDLEPFDTIAGYVREFMFLSFIIGLMLMTKNLIWG